MHSSHILADIPAFDGRGHIHCVIETPKGCANKYHYLPEWNAFGLKKVLPRGMVFPHNFGFVPSTCAEDGDALDVLVVSDEPLVTGLVLSARALGAITLRQRKASVKRGAWIRNDRLIDVVLNDHTNDHLISLNDLPAHFLTELKAFFVKYSAMEGRTVEPLDELDVNDALRLVEDARQTFVET